MRVIERLGGAREVVDEDDVHEQLLPRDVCFCDLFEEYTKISDKLTGMLLRARRHGAVNFPGELLLQGQHDNVVIIPLLHSRELQDRLDFGQNSEWGSSLARSATPAPAVMDGDEYRDSRMWD